MKYTIHGFSQQEAVKFKKNIIDKNGREKEIKIDCTDLLILRWFVDFYPKMIKIEIEGVQYAWVEYKKILEDLPLLDIKKQALYERLQKMCEFGILKHETVKAGGTYSYYGFGKKYGCLIDTNDSQPSKGEYSTNEGVGSQLSKGVYSTNEQINNSIKDTSIKNNNSIKDNNISTEFETLWKMYPRKLGKPKAFKSYTKARKSGVTFEQVKEGIENYLKQIKTNKTETEFIKHGSTWFGNECWNDEYDTTDKGAVTDGTDNANSSNQPPAWSGKWF